MKHIKKVRDFIKNAPVFGIGSISRIVGNREYAHTLVNHLLTRGEIKRAARGCYTNRDDVSVAVLCFKPAYLGLQNAMSIHNIWEQETIPIILTTRKARSGIRNVAGMNAMVRRISPKYFFGYEYQDVGDLLLPVSDVEKTFIDIVYFEEMRKETADEFKGRLDVKKLKSYLKQYPEKFRKRAMSFFGSAQVMK